MISEKDIFNEWAKFIEERFKGLELSVLPKVDTKHDYGPTEGTILADKLEEAVRCMCSHKASGGDDVITEYYKATAREHYLPHLQTQSCQRLSS